MAKVNTHGLKMTGLRKTSGMTEDWVFSFENPKGISSPPQMKYLRNKVSGIGYAINLR